MAKPTNYTIADITRYLQHEMTGPEMHAFEKAMLDDPFLADAFEGYANSNMEETKQQVAWIEQSIHQTKTAAPVRVLASRNNGWWKVAAVVLVFAGAGALLFTQNKNSTADSTVAKLEESATQNPLADSIGPADVAFSTAPPSLPGRPGRNSLLKTSPIIKEGTSSETASAPSRQAQTDSSNASLLATLPAAADERVQLQNSTPVPMAEKSLKMAGASAPVALQEFKGTVKDPEGEPLPFATIQLNKNQGTVADANGKFSFKAPDTSVNVSVVVVGYSTTKATLSARAKENAITVREKNEDGLAEVIVTGMMKKKKAQTNPDRIVYKSEGLEPAKGWKHYNDYLNSTIIQWLEDNEDFVTGDVEIEFTLNKRGRPLNIKLLNSVPEALAEQAMELLKNGPAFLPLPQTSKAQLTIQF